MKILHGHELIIRHLADYDKVLPWRFQLRIPESFAWMLAHYWYVELRPETVTEVFGVN